MIRKLVSKLVKKKKKEEEVKYIYMPFDKRYDEMSRREKREYKRWLNKRGMWDGAIVIENLEKEEKRKIKLPER